ncbi:hypothetical protein WJX79_009077 [Trebouxia sp. C0005]
MATGDVQGSVERLRSELRHIRYPADLDCTGAKLGVAAAFLPVLNYVLLKFSRHVAHQLVSAGYELQGKTDARFSEAAFKIFRDKFGLRPVLTAPQFLEQGFAERKLMLVSDVIAYCKSFHNAAVRRARLAAASAPTKSGKDATTSGKAAASQLSKGSRKSKAKSGLPRAPQHPRVQRHSDAVPGAETASASAAAALQARLCPSSAQLAHMDQSQNIDPNPWGPSAHALRAVSMRSVHQQDSHGMAAVSLHGPYDRLSQSAGHLPSQQQHASGAQYQSRAQGEAGIMPAATQAWVVNPAFGSESPMPSPEKQPRSQGPPMPHPSIYSTGAGPQHTTGMSARQQGSSAVSGHAAVQQPSPQQHSQDASRSMSFAPHLAHDQQQAARYMLSGVDMGAYVQGLHQRLAAAEEQAAQARQHGERQAHTLEARITLLEGRLSFVEGELAAERQHSAAAAQAGDSGGAQRSAEVAVCLSPSAAKARQDKAAAGLAAPHAVSKPPMTTPHRCMDVEASPTRSTAGTPRYRPGNGGVSRQLGLSVLAQQSPARSMRAPAVPASPASSMHSYKSTSELIESIQNRSRQRVSLLVRNLPLDARADEVREKFERFGEIRDVYLPRDYYTGRSRGFGFIEYRDPRDADDAMYRMDGANIGGRDITVVQSKEARKTPREMIVRDGPPSRGGGDRGGGRYRSRSPPRHSRRRSYSRSRSPPRRSRGRSYSRSPARSASRSASPRRSPARSLSRSPAREMEGSPRGSPARSFSRSPVRD